MSRARRYRAKVSGDVVKQRLESYGGVQARSFTAAVAGQVKIERLVKRIIEENGVMVTLNHLYMNFGKRLDKIRRTYQGDAAQLEACIEYERWYQRGLDSGTLDEIVVALGFENCAAPTPECDWLNKRKLTFSGNTAAADLDNFPVLVHLTSLNFNFNKAQASGQDIRFMDSDTCPDEGTPLKHEIEKWDKSGQDAWIWVKVPKVTGGSVNDFIYMFYNNMGVGDGQDAANVWDANYMLVLHMRGDGTATLPDSTSYGADGTKKAIGEPANLDPAAIDGGQRFDGTDDQVTVTDNGTICPFDGDFTVELWFTTDSIGTTTCMLSKAYSAGNWNDLVFDTDTGDDFRILGTDNHLAWKFILNWTNQVAADTWYHMAVSLSGTTATMYINGVQRAQDVTAACSDWDDTPLYLGRRILDTGNIYHHGLMDEVRTSDKARSQEWLMATYQNGAETFITYGPEE